MVKRKGNRKRALLRKADTQEVSCPLQLACLYNSCVKWAPTCRLRRKLPGNSMKLSVEWQCARCQMSSFFLRTRSVVARRHATSAVIFRLRVLRAGASVHACSCQLPPRPCGCSFSPLQHVFVAPAAPQDVPQQCRAPEERRYNLTALYLTLGGKHLPCFVTPQAWVCRWP